jgi:GNAT superfamily N-acetyltransferase
MGQHQTVRIECVAYDHPDASLLIAKVQQEDVDRYGDEDQTPVDPIEFAQPNGLFLVGYLDLLPIACGGWRRHADDAELKRMYVEPDERRKGFARAILAELERTAWEAGCRRMILETGEKQPEAIALYHSAGYAAVPRFGYYADDPETLHLGKGLRTNRPNRQSQSS